MATINAVGVSLSGQSGTGAFAGNANPTFTTPTLGVAVATTVNKVTITTPATGSTLTIADGKTLTASNTLTFTGNDSASVAFGAGGTVRYVGGGDNWVDETGASVTMTTNTGYTSDDGASLVTFTLPTASAIGDWLEINGKGSGGWSIAQATGQIIHINGVATTSGATGSLSSTNQYDAVRMRCLVANTTWEVVSMQSAGLTYV